MIRFRKILCPVDFSPTSQRALDFAVALAANYQASVHAIHVVAPVMGAAYVASLGVQELTLEFERQSKQTLQQWKTAAAKSGVRLDTEVRVGNVDTEILRAADKLKADLLVMGSHGRRTFARLVLGSVTERLIRHSRIPTLVIGPGQKRGVPPPALRRILVTTDFSDGTTDAMRYALSIAQEWQAAVTLLHVVNDITADTSGMYREAMMRGVEMDLQKLVPASVRDWCDVEIRVATGLPFRVIPNILKSGKFDLLVMNIHGKNMLDRAIIGSTAERALRAAAPICPVMLIPPLNGAKTKAKR